MLIDLSKATNQFWQFVEGNELRGGRECQRQHSKLPKERDIIQIARFCGTLLLEGDSVVGWKLGLSYRFCFVSSLFSQRLPVSRGGLFLDPLLLAHLHDGWLVEWQPREEGLRLAAEGVLLKQDEPVVLLLLLPQPHDLGLEVDVPEVAEQQQEVLRHQQGEKGLLTSWNQFEL
jgi:hypothetical protein